MSPENRTSEQTEANNVITVSEDCSVEIKEEVEDVDESEIVGLPFLCSVNSLVDGEAQPMDKRGRGRPKKVKPPTVSSANDSIQAETMEVDSPPPVCVKLAVPSSCTKTSDAVVEEVDIAMGKLSC